MDKRNNMKNIDLYDYFYGALTEADPQVQPQQEQPETNQQTPEEISKTVNPVKTPFDEFIGTTVKSIQFKPGQNGGAIEIVTSKSPVPLVISWVGDRVTARYKDVVALK